MTTHLRLREWPRLIIAVAVLAIVLILVGVVVASASSGNGQTSTARLRATATLRATAASQHRALSAQASTIAGLRAQVASLQQSKAKAGARELRALSTTRHELTCWRRKAKHPKTTKVSACLAGR